jgi:hypothetical protein
MYDPILGIYFTPVQAVLWYALGVVLGVLLVRYWRRW